MSAILTKRRHWIVAVCCAVLLVWSFRCRVIHHNTMCQPKPQISEVSNATLFLSLNNLWLKPYTKFYHGGELRYEVYWAALPDVTLYQSEVSPLRADDDQCKCLPGSSPSYCERKPGSF